MPVDKEIGQITSFVSGIHQYLFLRLGQGLKQSGGLFQGTLLEILKELKRKKLYIDDFIIHDKGEDNYKAQLTQFMEITTKFNLKSQTFVNIYLLTISYMRISNVRMTFNTYMWPL